jgi:phenylalanyl-tRNA synthetase beta chain
VVEEVGRLNGYDKLPLDLPRRDLTPAVKNPSLQLKADLRAQLASMGANEVLTYTFVHGNLLDKVGQSREQAFTVSNALSPDLQYYRLSLTPSLLDVVHANIRASHDVFALFEMGLAHNKVDKDDEGLPHEQPSLAFVFAASDKVAGNHAGAPYYQARVYLMYLLKNYSDILSDLHYKPLAEADLFASPWLMHAAAPFEPGRSAVVTDGNGVAWGIIGEYKASVRTKLKLPAFAAGFELDFNKLLASKRRSRYFAKPRFPSVEQDICLKVSAGTPYKDVFTFVAEQQNELAPKESYLDIGPVDIYQREDDQEHKQITLRLTFAHYDRTLTDQEVTELLDKIAAAAQEKLGAERI